MAEDRLDDALKWDELRMMVQEELHQNDSQERDNYMSQASKANTMVAGGSNSGYPIPAPHGPSMTPHLAMQAPVMHPQRQPAIPQPGMQFPIQVPQPAQMLQPPQPAVPAPGDPRMANPGMYNNGKVQWVKSSRWSFDAKTPMPGAIADRLSSGGKPRSGSMQSGGEGGMVPPQAHLPPGPQHHASNASALDPRRARTGNRQVEMKVIDVPRGGGAGNVGGIGMLFEKRSWEPYFRITGLLENGTAQAHGVRVDDFLLEVNGHPISSLTAKEVTGRILGVPGTLVRLKTANPFSLVVAGRAPARGASPVAPGPPRSNPPRAAAPQQPPQQAPNAPPASPPLETLFPLSQHPSSLHFLAHAKASSSGMPGVPSPFPPPPRPQSRGHTPSPSSAPPFSQPVPAPYLAGASPVQQPSCQAGEAATPGRRSVDLDSVEGAKAAAQHPPPSAADRRWRDKSGAAFSVSAPHVTPQMVPVPVPQLEHGAI